MLMTLFHSVLIFAAWSITGTTLVVDGRILTGVTVVNGAACRQFITEHVGEHHFLDGVETYLVYKDKGRYFDDGIAGTRKPERMLNKELLRIGCAKVTDESFSQREQFKGIAPRPNVYPTAATATGK
jgi:hypothetical protein